MRFCICEYPGVARRLSRRAVRFRVAQLNCTAQVQKINILLIPLFQHAHIMLNIS